jgi:predicted dehydrogenase
MLTASSVRLDIDAQRRETVMAKKMQRRQFLGAAAATGAALAAPNVLRAQGGSNQLVVGVMGTGSRGTSLAQAYARLQGITVAYVCDVDERRAGQAAEKVAQAAPQGTPAAQPVKDFQRILDDRNVNIFICAACNHWHAPASILACAAGKHVYVEKPCSHNPREGELLVQAARRHDRKVQMGNQRRSWPKVQEAMQALKEGAIGRVYLARCWYQNNRPSIGRAAEGAPPQGLDYDLWQGPAPRKPYHSNYLPYNWHWFWHWGNGEIGNNGVHFIDVCRWGLGVDYPIRVTSSGGHYRYEDDQETPDTHTVCFDFPDRKSIVWEGTSCNRMPKIAVMGRPAVPSTPDILFLGENGSLAINGNAYTIYDNAGVETKRETGPSSDEMHFRNFLEAVRGNGRLNSEIEEGHKSTLPCHLGNIAHRTGHTLRCEPTNGHIIEDQEANRFWQREYHGDWLQRLTAAAGGRA